jgi:hypothetical protein
LFFEWDPKIFEFEKNYQNRNHRFENLKVEAQTCTLKSNQPFQSVKAKTKEVISKRKN